MDPASEFDDGPIDKAPETVAVIPFKQPPQDRPPPEAAPLTRPAPLPRRGYDHLSDINRALPYSDDAEKGVLSCFLQNPVDLLADARESLPSDTFYHPVNRQVYEELQTFANRPDQKALDLVTFSQHLIDKGLMDKIGGPAFLAELLSFVPTPAHYPYYRGIMRDKWMLRRVIAYHTEGIQRSYEFQEDINALLDKMEADALKVRPPEDSTGSEVLKEAVACTIESLQRRMLHTGELAGLSTGLPWLDEMTTGLLPGIYYLGARPAISKTALALNIFDAVILGQETPAGFFSLEMAKERLILRMIAKRAYVPLTALMKGKLDPSAQKKVMQAARDMQAQNVRAFIDDRSGLSLSQIANKTRRWKKQHGIKFVVIDYLQRMAVNPRNFNKADSHAENSTGLADLAKDLQIPFLVVAQLNRLCETEKRAPRMSDFEGCGRIEQDGDGVWLLSRHKKQPESPYDRHITLDIAKNRDGPTGREVHLFRGPFMRYEADPVHEDLLK